jgi:hypothetical protein
VDDAFAGQPLHEEKHGRAFTEAGGTLEMVQLWVNLPAKHKMSAPRYQEIRDATIPVVTLGSDGSIARIIAGDYDGTQGPARTFTPVNLWDLRLTAGNRTALALPAGDTAILLVLQGALRSTVTTVNAASCAVRARGRAGRAGGGTDRSCWRWRGRSTADRGPWPVRRKHTRGDRPGDGGLPGWPLRKRGPGPPTEQLPWTPAFAGVTDSDSSARPRRCGFRQAT